MYSTTNDLKDNTKMDVPTPTSNGLLCLLLGLQECLAMYSTTNDLKDNTTMDVPTPTSNGHDSTEDTSQVLALLRQLTEASPKPPRLRSDVAPPLNATGQSASAYAFAPARPHADPYLQEEFLRWQAGLPRTGTRLQHRERSSLNTQLIAATVRSELRSLFGGSDGRTLSPAIARYLDDVIQRPAPPSAAAAIRAGYLDSMIRQPEVRPEDGPPPGELDRLYPKQHYPDLR